MKPALSAIAQIRSLLADVGDRLLRAGQLYVAEVDRDPSFRDIMRAEFPTMTGAFLRDLELVGRGALCSRALELGLACGSKLKRLPISEQERLLSEGVEIWTGKDTRTVPITECGPAIMAQIFGKDHVRDPSEQAAWHEEQSARRRQEATDRRELTTADGTRVIYKIEKSRKRVRIIHPPCVLTARDLAKIMAELS